MPIKEIPSSDGQPLTPLVSPISFSWDEMQQYHSNIADDVQSNLTWTTIEAQNRQITELQDNNVRLQQEIESAQAAWKRLIAELKEQSTAYVEPVQKVTQNVQNIQDSLNELTSSQTSISAEIARQISAANAQLINTKTFTDYCNNTTTINANHERLFNTQTAIITALENRVTNLTAQNNTLTTQCGNMISQFTQYKTETDSKLKILAANCHNHTTVYGGLADGYGKWCAHVMSYVAGKAELVKM